MKIVEPHVELEDIVDSLAIMEKIERAARTCYKSEGKIEEGSAEKLIRSCIKRGHESVIEHASVTLRFVCDRGVSHEIVRHRIASYSQESTRYVNYKDGIEFIRPCFWENDPEKARIWKTHMEFSEVCYGNLIKFGATPQEARSVLPNSTKTELVVTMNLREWRHFLKLRCSTAAHPQMRQVACMARDILKAELPVIFEDIEES